MRYWLKLYDIQAMLRTDRSRDPKDLSVWLDYPFMQAEQSGLVATLGRITGISAVRLRDVLHGEPGTTIINIAKRSRQPWEQLLPQILKIVREQLAIQEELEEILEAPWHASE